MHVAIAAAISVDGKLTRHDELNIQAWVSAEDQVHFRSLLAAHDAIIMGSGTYEAGKTKLQPGKLRVVLTTRPKQYADQAVPDQLEFIDQSAPQITKSLQIRGYQNVLIIGGGQMITDFLAAGLVDRLYLTVEPRIFGTGKPLVASLPLDIQLHLEKYQQLNDQGTMLLTYQVR